MPFVRKLIFLPVFLFSYCFGQAQAPGLIIKNVNVIPISNDLVLANVSVGITGNIITHIGSFNQIPKTKKTNIIEGNGKFLMPGLADMHIHMPPEESIDTFLLLNVIAGVSQLRVMNSKAEPLAIKAQVKRRQLMAPRIYYSYLYYSDSVFSAVQADSLVGAIKREGYDMIKIFRVKNEETFNNLMDAAHKNKVVVGGHFPNRNIPLTTVLNKRYRSIEHLGGYDNGSNDSLLTAQIQFTVKNQVFNCPTLDWTQLVWDQISANAMPSRLGMEYAPTSYKAKWQDEYNKYLQNQGVEKVAANKKNREEAFAKKLQLLKKLNEANALLLVGSDPETYYQLPGFSMYEEMLTFSRAGISNYDILKAATWNAALFFGEEKQWGSIDVGKQAHVILLAKNPLADIRNINSVEMTMIDGRVFFKKDLQPLVQ